VYVADYAAAVPNVVVLSYNRPIASIPIPRPAGFVYDPVNHYMYVANYGDGVGNVSVLNGTTIVAWIDDVSFDGPYQGVYDPSDGWVYFGDVNGWTVTAINGTKVAGSVGVGHYPAGLAYDPVTHDVWVTNTGSVANGGSKISVLNRLSVVDTITGNMTNPSGIAWDPQNGYFYVGDKNLTNWAVGYVTVYDNYTAIATFPASQDTYGVAYDPANGYVYALGGIDAYLSADRLAAIDGTRVVGNVTLAAGCAFVAYDPGDQDLYAANPEAGTVSVVDTVLAEGPISLDPNGTPSGSLDLGQSVRLNSSLSSVGALPDAVALAVDPASGLGCHAAITVVYGTGWANLSTSCAPTVPGNYSVWFNVTDSEGSAVWAQVALEVFADPTLPRPVATRSGGLPASSADAMETIWFSESPSGGSGPAGPLAWAGLPSGECGVLGGTDTARCLFDSAIELNVSASITDSNGEGATSPVLSFWVHPALVAAVPFADPGSVDVGQSVSFGELPSGGLAPYGSFNWTGLNGSCTGVETARPNCTYDTPTVLTIRVSFSDANGIVVVSDPLIFGVDPRLAVGAPSANRSSVDALQAVEFSALASGGSGSYNYSWTGMPAGCWGLATPTPTCIPGSAGTYGPEVAVVDSDGSRVNSSGGAWFTVYTDPVVGAVGINPPNVEVGQSVMLDMVVAGGAGGDHYHWAGLPPGCASASASQLSCVPSRAGVFEVSVDVTDANGYQAMSNQSVLNVSSAPATGVGTGLLSGAWTYGAVGAVVIVVAVVVALAALRGRRTRTSGRGDRT
jgi:DNA-binding beta-propeller fold protein YncE